MTTMFVLDIVELRIINVGWYDILMRLCKDIIADVHTHRHGTIGIFVLLK
jgi:hypothetical protein